MIFKFDKWHFKDSDGDAEPKKRSTLPFERYQPLVPKYDLEPRTSIGQPTSTTTSAFESLCHQRVLHLDIRSLSIACANFDTFTSAELQKSASSVLASTIRQ